MSSKRLDEDSTFKGITDAYARVSKTVSGEKRIGRFAVRYLGRKLSSQSIARDAQNRRTLLGAEFKLAGVRQEPDLGKMRVHLLP